MAFDSQESFDVLVCGGGVAALVSAITASSHGAKVLLAECSPENMRGGNGRHTIGMLASHDSPTELQEGIYNDEELFRDLSGLTRGKTNEKLARLAIRESSKIPGWMMEHGVQYHQPPGLLSLQRRTSVFAQGGGKEMLNALYRAAANKDVRIRYETEIFALEIRDNTFVGARARSQGKEVSIHAKSVIASSSGFESNIEWLRGHWGNAIDNFVIRGTKFNQGFVLKSLIDNGAQPVGDPKGFHGTAMDYRAPKFDGGSMRVDCIPYGIVVNQDCQRFYDEGEDFWVRRYAIWGELIAGQPGQVGFAIADSKVSKQLPLIDSDSAPVSAFQADSLEQLAKMLDLDPRKLKLTVESFNSAIQPASFDAERLDDSCTKGLKPNKSHWARKIDTPPFFGYRMKPGLSFTDFGLKVNERAQILMKGDIPAKNVFAAGAIMYGNILSHGYIGGVGLMVGSTFGRIAGKHAAEFALAKS